MPTIEILDLDLNNTDETNETCNCNLQTEENYSNETDKDIIVTIFIISILFFISMIINCVILFRKDNTKDSKVLPINPNLNKINRMKVKGELGIERRNTNQSRNSNDSRI